VILTSHDAGDLEALCKRVIIINHGQIVYQDKVSTLKRRYLTTKTVSIRYAEQVPADFGIAGTEVLKTSQYGVKLRFDSSATRVEDVIAQLARAGSIVDITISDPPLEEVIRAIYAETGR
jgi:ABC-2 type transport system ATP-binding protein